MQHALIVEDVAETERWLSQCLTEAFTNIQITIATSCLQARQILEITEVSLVLLEIGLPDGNGTELIRCIRQHRPNAFIVVTTNLDDRQHVLEALQAGAHGYLLKDTPGSVFVQKLRGILNGDPPLSPSIARQILRAFSELPLLTEDLPITGLSTCQHLSKRQQEVLILVAKGLSRKEVAEALGLSENTVAHYIRDVYQKLDISTRAEAAVEACRLGLVNTGNGQ